MSAIPTSADLSRAIEIVQAETNLHDVPGILFDVADQLRDHARTDPATRSALIAVLRARIAARRAISMLAPVADDAWMTVHSG